MINKYKNFLESKKDLIEFPIKKFMSIIKSNIENKISTGLNEFYFDFKSEKTLPISFIISINYDSNKNNSGGYIKRDEVNKVDKNGLKFNSFKIYINIGGNYVDYNQLYSIINHELKHVYDLYYENYNDSFDRVDGYNYLKYKYSNCKEIIDFLEISNLSLKHEMEARNSMIYDKLRWLKTFDREQLKTEFQKTYIYKSIFYIKNYDYSQLLLLDLNELINFTNEYIEFFIKSDIKMVNRIELINFYKKIKDKFSKTSIEYLEKCEIILDELVRDNRPYMENKLLEINDDFNWSPNSFNDISHLDKFISNYFKSGI